MWGSAFYKMKPNNWETSVLDEQENNPVVCYTNYSNYTILMAQDLRNTQRINYIGLYWIINTSSPRSKFSSMLFILPKDLVIGIGSTDLILILTKITRHRVKIISRLLPRNPLSIQSRIVYKKIAPGLSRSAIQHFEKPMFSLHVRHTNAELHLERSFNFEQNSLF